jgi:formylglycine-generating enzyme required for sulfatase activity
MNWGFSVLVLNRPKLWTFLRKLPSEVQYFYEMRALDLHGLVWEWVEDFDTLFAPRGPSEHEHAGIAMSPGDTAMSCGAAALSVSDPENYPMILRLAVLSSLNRNSITADLGFRCARSATSQDRRRTERKSP